MVGVAAVGDCLERRALIEILKLSRGLHRCPFGE